MRTFLALVWMAVLLLVLGCSINKNSTDGGTVNSASDTKSPAMIPLGASGPKPNFEPLPSKYLSEIDDPAADSCWSLFYHGLDNSTPPRSFAMFISYRCGDNLLVVSGEPGSTPDGYWPYRGESYGYISPSHQPLFDIVDYIEQHPDVFFDYTEFNDDPYPFASFIHSEERFTLFLMNYVVDGNYHSYRISKGIGGPEPDIPEIVHVINMIKTEFLDELLRHPE